MKLDGYTLINKMRRTRRRYPLTATEQALYHELILVSNDDEWKDTFFCCNTELCNALSITEKTLTVARQSLINAGLIFYKCGKSKRQISEYSFVKNIVTTGNITVDSIDKVDETTVAITPDNTTDNTTVEELAVLSTGNFTPDNPGLAVASTVKFPDYNKTKQTKLNNTEEEGGEPPPVNFKKISELEFINEVNSFKEKYSEEMLKAFVRYWSEKNPKGKMKFQLQDTWETSRRLETWASKPFNSNGNGASKQPYQKSNSRNAGAERLAAELREELGIDQ